MKKNSQRADLTFKHNQNNGRHGWLRLTPAYSVKAVMKYLRTGDRALRVLDPFSGTGTTGLLCAEMGIPCDLVELNPFLAWFARAKTRSYPTAALQQAHELAAQVIALAASPAQGDYWVPPIRFIERWWNEPRLEVLAQIFHHLETVTAAADPFATDLLKIAFCRLIIQWSNAAFNHQSMSFKDEAQATLPLFDERDEILDSFRRFAQQTIEAARAPLQTEARVFEGDSRRLPEIVKGGYSQVITSPPYPNRMSYIRELRPYMYWLGYLTETRQAGELDWRAIGGTWGVATSRLTDWEPEHDTTIAHDGFYEVVDEIAASPNKNSVKMANYVHRYFVDAATHLANLVPLLSPNAEVIYIVGNSRFYEVVVPVEQIYASLMRQRGLADIRIETLRKRNSKKELYEFAVIGRMPG